MDNIKSTDYIQELVKNYGVSETIDILTNVGGYILMDNDHQEARMFLDNIIDFLDECNI